MWKVNIILNKSNQRSSNVYIFSSHNFFTGTVQFVIIVAVLLFFKKFLKCREHKYIIFLYFQQYNPMAVNRMFSHSSFIYKIYNISSIDTHGL